MMTVHVDVRKSPNTPFVAMPGLKDMIISDSFVTWTYDNVKKACPFSANLLNIMRESMDCLDHADMGSKEQNMVQTLDGDRHPQTSSMSNNCPMDSHTDSGLFLREAGMILGDETGPTSGHTDFTHCPSDFYGQNVSRTGNQNDAFGLSHRPWSEEMLGLRNVRRDSRSPHYPFVAPQSHLVRSYEQTSPLHNNQGRQFSTICNIRQYPRPGFLTAPNQPVINRQVDYRFANQPTVMISISDLIPIDLQHVQPLQQTLAIEDIVRYEVAVGGGFEMRGTDMDALYTLAGL